DDEAQRRVVNFQIAYERGQWRQPCGSEGDIVRLAVGGDLFDVHWRRKFVERKVVRIDDADAIQRPEPQSSIRGLGGLRTEAPGRGTASYSVGVVENCGLDRPPRISQPRVQLGACNAHETAGGVQPERVSVVFQCPVNPITGQSILAI